eukprot:CAMPEP_0172599430 /NCGR_PEP_ID=MMETSP1068-20121228/19525_1 /TAXON_ID=35684 /ORGANISM="Pseudopedinella elastica, Strain CCMP716" /LENGTH=58 /DNA_ID=CAMNT_0013399681 /DNA_START=86 /DNA_END=258 /DNA_ORIENTATION=-
MAFPLYTLSIRTISALASANAVRSSRASLLASASAASLARLTSILDWPIVAALPIFSA